MEKLISGTTNYYANEDGYIKRIHKGKANVLIGAVYKGYRSVQVKIGDKFITKKVHRLIAETLIDNPDNKPEVNHKNGVTTDNRKENLEWCTRSENEIHSYRVLGRIDNLSLRYARLKNNFYNK